MANCIQIADPKTHTRRNLLKSFSIQEFKKTNRCQILVSITTRAVHLVNGISNPAETLIGDLEAVIIGANMTDCCGRGLYFVGNTPRSFWF
ncbi:MAG: hypothetical protein GXP19_08530 [Gammaproteobacteria bacterium]|nr:hypothetical protein [Gammaproteobacteria bacterium]